MRGIYFVKEVFLCLPSCILILLASLSLCRCELCYIYMCMYVDVNLHMWLYNNLTSLLLLHLSSSLTDSLPSLNLLCHLKTDAWFMQDAPKAVLSIPYVSVAAFFPSLKHNFIAYRSSKVQIGFLKVTSCDNQNLVGCIPIPAAAVHLSGRS